MHYSYHLTRRLFVATLAGVWMLLAASVFGQHAETMNGGFAPAIPSPPPAPQYETHTVGGPGLLSLPEDPYQLEAQFDVQFNYSLNDSIVNPQFVSYAGVVYTGTEFWVSSWRSDTVYRLSPTGSVLGQVTTLLRANGSRLAGIRGFTWDGANIWACNVSNRLFKIDPVTRTITDSITIGGTVAARFAAYDPSVNGGLGGFHVGNFTSAFNTVSMTGTVLQTVPAASHGVVGAYGGVVDNISAGGPYLWLFAQEGAGANNTLKAVKLPGMNPRSLSRNAALDFTLPATAVSGGAFIASGLVPGKNTIGGIIQNSPNRLIGYELDVVQIDVDANLRALRPAAGLAQAPFDQVASVGFAGTVRNDGELALTSVKVKTEVIDLNTLAAVNADSTTLSNLAPAASANFTVSPIAISAPGNFTYVTYLNTGAQVDQFTANDTLVGFYGADSTFARDNGQLAGSLGFGANNDGILGQTYTLSTAQTLTGLTAAFINPPVGQSTTAYVYTMGATTPAAQAHASNTYTFTAADSGLVTVNFKFANPTLSPGTWYFGVDEKTGGANIRLAYSNSFHTPGTGFLQFASSGNWSLTENLGFPVAYVIRPHFDYCLGVSASVTLTDDDGTGNGSATVTPAGGFPPFSFLWNDPQAQTGATATGLAGGQTYTVIATDSRGCVATVTSDTLESNPPVSATGPCENLFFSEYLEGSSSNKALEIYNASPDTANLQDYQVHLFSNGSVNASIFRPRGFLAPGEVYVIGNAAANAAILAVSDTTGNATFFNGNDALALIQTTTGDTLDIIGIIGNNPGASWPVGSGSTAEFTLVRKSNVNKGELNWTISSTQWDVFPQNFSDSLGSHFMIPCSSTPSDTFFVGFQSATLNVQESAGTVNIPLIVSPGPTDCSVLVSLVPGGTATPGDDFVFASPDTVTFSAAGPAVANTQVLIIDDLLLEGPESFTLRVDSLDGCRIGAINQIVITIIDNELPVYPIGLVTADADGNGLPDSLNVRCEVRGVVYGVDLRGPLNGIQITIRDQTGGIGVFTTQANRGYDIVTEGDSIHVRGTVQHFNGLAQMGALDTVIFVAANQPLRPPVVVDSLGEYTESELIKILCVKLVNPAQWTGTGGSFTAQITNGTTIFDLRIDNDVDLSSTPAPKGYFNVIGIGGQFKTSAPFTSGYQILPRYQADIELLPAPQVSFADSAISISEAAPSVTVVVSFAGLNPENTVARVLLDTLRSTATLGQDFTIGADTVSAIGVCGGAALDSILITLIDDPVIEGDETIVLYLEIIENGIVKGIDTLVITLVDDLTDNLDKLLNQGIKAYPNPGQDLINLRAEFPMQSVRLLDLAGRVAYAAPLNDLEATVPTSSLPAGVYVLEVVTSRGRWLQRWMKQ